MHFLCNYTYDEVWTLVRLLSIITSVKIASTEKYAIDIEDLSVFCLNNFFIQSEMKGGGHLLDGLLRATLRECRTAFVENINKSLKHKLSV